MARRRVEPGPGAPLVSAGRAAKLARMAPDESSADPVRFEVTAGAPLEGDVDVEALIAEVPEGYRIRGLFFRPLVDELGSRFGAIAPRLDSPPPPDGYRPLSAYPTRDFLRVFDAAARLQHPGCGGREAHRRRARREVEVFAASLMGKAVLSIVHSPATALLRYPEAFGLLALGPSGRATQETPNLVRIELADYRGSIEYPIGVLEGLVMSFRAEPRVEVRLPEPGRVTFVVTWK